MSLFVNLYLGHLLGDFLFQPGRLVLAKRDGAPGLLLHTIIVGLATAGVCFATLGVDWPSIVLVTGMHLVIERLTIVTYLKTPTRGLFTLLFDQTLHLLSIGIVVWLAGDWALDAAVTTFGLRLPVSSVATLDGLLSVTLFGSVLVFEMANALRRDDTAKGGLLRFDLRRAAGMAERGAAFVAALAWTPAAGLLAFVPRLVHAATTTGSDRTTQIAEAAAGAVLCALVYAAVAAISYLTTGSVAPRLLGALAW